MNRYIIVGGETFLYSYYPHHFLLPNQFGRKPGNSILVIHIIHYRISMYVSNINVTIFL